MAEAEAAAIDNQQAEIFELQVEHLSNRMDANERINDARFEKIEALMAKNFLEQEAMINEIRSEVKEIRSEFNEIRSEFKEMNSRMSRMERNINGGWGENINSINGHLTCIKDDIGSISSIMAEIKDELRGLNASIDTFERRLPWNLALMGIITVVAFTVIQHFLK